MKFLIVNNKNSASLPYLVESLYKNIKGQSWSFETFDATGTLNQNGIAHVTGSNNLKEWILSKMEGDPDDLYAIIDENKIAVGEIDASQIRETMSNQDIFCFSLALGKNITFCANMNCDNVFRPMAELDQLVLDQVVKWDWSVHYMDFGYPLNLDGTIFRGKELRKFVKNIAFSNTLELENGLQIFDDYPKNIMAAFNISKMIEVIFEKPELLNTFDYEKLEKNRTKYQILKKDETTDQIPDKVEA